MCRSSRAIILRCNSKTQWQMFLLLYGRHVGGVSIQSSINSGDTLLQITCEWKTADLTLGKVVYISIIYRISDSWLFSLNGYDFYFDHMTGENRELGYYRWPVQNSQWYRLIQPRSVATWPILYPASVKESPRRLTKFFCGFRKCHSVCSNIWEVSFVTTLLILIPLTRKCFGWVYLWLNFLFSLIGKKINKRLKRSIGFPV